MPDFQLIAARRRVAKAERNLADDHDIEASRAVDETHRTFHHRAARSCRARADAYEERAERDEALYHQDAYR